MINSDSMYAQLGVDADKSEVRENFAPVIENKFPGAFVNIIPDITDPSGRRYLTHHLDGDGSKMVQRFVNFMDSGDINVFSGAVDDAFAMNLGDIAAAGFVFGRILVGDVLNVNLEKDFKSRILYVIAKRIEEILDLYKTAGFDIHFLGGETADLPDQVGSAVFDMSVTAWADFGDLVLGKVRPGDIIYGVRSDGQAVWEKEPNSGLMSNGLTLARSALLSHEYNVLYPHLKRNGKFYAGRYNTDSKPDLLGGVTVGEALTSPSRQWAILIRRIMENLRKAGVNEMLHGITQNTGGGATKIKHIGKGGICYHKSMPLPPALFKLIQKESGEKWENMYRTFNCGIGIDIIGEDDHRFANALAKACEMSGLSLFALGHCSSYDSGNKVCLRTPYGEFEY